MSVQALFSRLRCRIERLAEPPYRVSSRRLARGAEVSDKTVRNFISGRDIGAKSYDAILAAVVQLEAETKVPSCHEAPAGGKPERPAA